jgi:DNA topoisomerase-1
VTLIEEKKLNPGKGRRFGADPGKQLGEHPQKGGMIVAKTGRYGPYVSHNGINANLPNDKTPETITLDEAVGLIDARAESGGGSRARRKRPARGAPAPKQAAAAKTTAAKPKKRAAASTAKAPRKSKKTVEAAE